jgi:hypothetical protein
VEEISRVPSVSFTADASAQEMASSLPLWVEAADDSDELEVALWLTGENLSAPIGSVEPAVVRARLLLLLSRPDEAVAVLDRAKISSPGDELPTRWEGFVLVACQAAAGDRAAYSTLLRATANVPPSRDSWRTAYLVAAAAEQLGDYPTAQRAWSQLTVDHGIHTRLTVTHFTAGAVFVRDRNDPTEAARIVMANAANFDAMLGGTEPDPDPVHACARLLTERDDVAGARLLFQAVHVRRPREASLAAAAVALEPREAMKRYRLACGLACLLLIPAVPLGLVGIVLFWGGRRLWLTRVTVPGFSLVDSRAWRSLRSLRFDTTRQRTASARDTSAANVLGAVLGFCAGMPLAAVSLWALDAVIDESNPSNVGMVILISAVLLALGGATFAGHNLSQRLQRRITKHRLAKQAAKAERKLRADAQACRCWQAIHITGLAARWYLQDHLVEQADIRQRSGALSGLGEDTRLGKCPNTGVLWLGTQFDTPGRAMLLRGVGPAPGGGVPGFYM